ncbi:hypothetical protein EF514_07165 [Anaerosphaera multitolerans]|uniref:Uncharacterized protein n=1 Tax=Anaerosphaera multitolerans TaxID=2487351 RepID=A0A437S6C9_9FIRM|nr:hypothetical protein EF514_07165 [Anaerosphaera multitolerans]
MMKKYLIIGIGMLVCMILFIGFALYNPQLSLPISLNLTYVIYLVYILIIVIMFIFYFKTK